MSTAAGRITFVREFSQGSTLISRFRFEMVCLVVVNLLVFQSERILCAQAPPPASPPQAVTEPPSENGNKPASKGTSQNGIPALPAPPPFADRVLFLRNDKGEYIAVPLGPTLEDYLKFRRDQTATKAATNEWSLSRLSLDGDVKGDLAHLTARIRLKITKASGPVLIPLKFQEATLQDFQHEEGPGDLELKETNLDQGQVWSFSEKGDHVLRLSLIQKIRKDVPTRRLQLTLPDCPISELKLKVPFARVRATTTDERIPLEVSPGPEGTSFIQLTGLGSRLDLSWQPLQEQLSAATLLTVRSGMNVIIDGRTLLMEVNQRVEALQGTFSELHVTFPPGMEILKIEGTRYKEHRIESRDNSLVTVLLKEPVTTGDFTELKWTVRREIPPNVEQVALQGFSIDQARFQTGVISVRVLGAYRIQKNDDQDRNVERESLAALERMSNPSIPGQNDPSNIAAVFRFSTQPFRLALDLRKLEPYVAVESPQYVMHFAGDRLDLEMNASVQVSRGAIDQLTLLWPRWKEDGWKINPSELRKSTGNGSPEQRIQLLPDESAPGQIKLQTIDPLEGQFNLRITAQRPIKKPEELQVTVPLIEATNQRQGTADLITILADNLDLQVKPAEKTTIRPRDRTNLKSDLLSRYPELRRMAYQLENYQDGIRAQINLQTPRLRTESLASLSLTDNTLNVDQVLTYEASYKRMTQLLLWVPVEWGNQTRFTLLPGTPLAGVPTGTEEKGYQQLRLTLDPARMGRFEIRAQAKISSSEIPSQEPYTVHFIRMLDQAAEVSRLKLSSFAGSETTLQDPAWTRTTTPEGQVVWVSQGERGSARLTLNRSRGSEISGGVVQKSWIRMAVARDGEASTLAFYRLTGIGNHLRVEFPGKVDLLAVSWNGKRLESNRWNSSTGGYDIDLPPSAGEVRDQLLTLEYRQVAQVRSVLGQSYRLELPILPVGTRFKEMICEVALPPDAYLWSCPPGMTPFYRWTLHNLLWSRRSLQTSEELARWMDLRDAPAASSEYPSWNVYRFSRYGADSSLEVPTLRRHLLVLLGAGRGLLFTMLLVYVPLLRHVLLFWTVSFLLAVFSLWYTEPILLLLQPVVFGFLLALLSAVIQHFRGKSILLPRPFQRQPRESSPPVVSSLQLEPGVSPQGSTAIRAQRASVNELGSP
ncbi:MAG: hypothetical protein U0903_07650 [Planctomycetales bacterium]